MLTEIYLCVCVVCVCCVCVVCVCVIHPFKLIKIKLREIESTATPPKINNKHKQTKNLILFILFFLFFLKSYYTEQKYKRKTFVFAPIFHELNSKI